ncbi:DUF418 domain-containing protein [Hyalangium sp.]|uniref:DUF418 domain-containing protein n=1 Tax=Hyalangium sp. TaxID=2028555 RepID=UPI002D6398C9|nr:DUF418 domain-containing protein [Hyalangium sp.]HYH97373.1 DUF418 domain-containing protein [Hyalangium sp.]
MTSSPAAVPTPLAEARPVDGNERLTLLDALRGFALCGVFISNTYMWFSGRFLLPRAQMEATLASASLLDHVTIRATGFLVFGKFITLFSFLFGLGFAVQMGRAEQRGASIVPLYARRLGVLLLIGLSHLFLLWFGDILTTYALLGFGLLLFRNRLDKTLLIWAAALILVAPIAGMVLLRLPELLGPSGNMAEAAKTARENSEALRAQLLVAFKSGIYLDVIRANATWYLQEFIRPLIPSMLAIFGRFLLGLVAGRNRIFHEPTQHLPLLRKVLLWGLGVGVIATGASAAMQMLSFYKVLKLDDFPWLPFAMWPVRQLGEVGLAAFYLTGFTLLFQRSTWQRVLSVLAPVGRMALTNYLSQTVISLFIFYGYGLGLIGTLGPKAIVALPIGIFVLQIGVSHLWLSRFRFGPVEWVWRSLTYGKAQPMRRTSTEEPGAATGV